MGIFGNRQQKNGGFTIVELIVVVVVIGILVSIVALVYPGYQKRTRDSERKSDVSQIAASLSAYALQKNTYITSGSGCGLSGNGNGWLNVGPTAQYPKSISTCLQDAGVLASGIFSDPSGCVSDTGGVCGTSGGVSVPAYMKVTCQKSSKSVTYVLAYLELSPSKDAEVDGLCDSGTVDGFSSVTQKWGTNYGMNYYVLVK
jgi:prepilin-type N-terminal cleavage/methylation domain-containing protein